MRGSRAVAETPGLPRETWHGRAENGQRLKESRALNGDPQRAGPSQSPAGETMSGRPIAYVMEQTLGSVTHYLNLRSEESASETPRPYWIPIGHRAGRLPWSL